VKTKAAIAFPALTMAIAALYLFGYRGAGSSENLEIVQTEVSSARKIATLVRRSDHQALNGDTYFVFVSDREFSVLELRKKLYAFDPVFRAGRDGLSISWASPQELIIKCLDCGITRDLMEKQRFSQGNVAIRYAGFP